VLFLEDSTPSSSFEGDDMMALMRMSLLGLSNLQPSTVSQSSPPRLVSVLAHQSVVAKPRLETGKRMVIRAAGAGNDESATDVDVSVFRFTLGQCL